MKTVTENGYDLKSYFADGHNMPNNIIDGSWVRRGKMFYAGLDCSAQGIIVVKEL